MFVAGVTLIMVGLMGALLCSNLMLDHLLRPKKSWSLKTTVSKAGRDFGLALGFFGILLIGVSLVILSVIYQ